MRCLWSIAISVLLSAFASSQMVEGASVNGTVADAYGKPVAYAYVFAERAIRNGSAVGYRMRASVVTDANGKFAIKQLQAGEYRLWTSKPDAGLRSTRPDIFTENAPPLIVVAPGAVVSDVALRFAPQAGKLKVHVTDAVSGKGLKFNVNYAPLARSTTLDGIGGFRMDGTILVPADTDMVVEVESEGHLPSRTTLHLDSGTEKRVDVALVPTQTSETRN